MGDRWHICIKQLNLSLDDIYEDVSVVFGLSKNRKFAMQNIIKKYMYTMFESASEKSSMCMRIRKHQDIGQMRISIRLNHLII